MTMFQEFVPEIGPEHTRPLLLPSAHSSTFTPSPPAAQPERHMPTEKMSTVRDRTLQSPDLETGAPRETRTPDLLITNQLLFQLSYRGCTSA